MMKKVAPFIILILTLIAAVSVQLVGFVDVENGNRDLSLKSIELANSIPSMLPGWKIRDEPLGATEVAAADVRRTLNFDEAVYRIYSKQAFEVGVYVAYWSPGRMPIQKVASHTPDRCWSEGGWTCEEQRSSVRLLGASGPLRSGYWRRFKIRDQVTYVIYWHLVGGTMYDYGDRLNARPDVWKWWRDTVKYAYAGSDPQVFIRVTSNCPFDALEGEDGWKSLIASLADLGLRESVAAKKGL